MALLCGEMAAKWRRNEVIMDRRFALEADISTQHDQQWPIRTRIGLLRVLSLIYAFNL